MLHPLRAAGLAALLAVAACSPTFNWREWPVPGTPLRALMPCKPESASRPVPMLGTPVELHLHACETGGMRFALAWADIGRADQVPAALAAWRVASLQTLRVVAASPDDPGLAWTVEVKGAPQAQGDEKNLKLTGSETVTYFNNSPDELVFLWLQLDENQHSTVNNANYQTSNAMNRQTSPAQLYRIDEARKDNGYGFNIVKLTDAAGKPLKYSINKTMMRVELPAPLKAGQLFVFKLDWDYKIVDRLGRGGRGGYEFFLKMAIIFLL